MKWFIVILVLLVGLYFGLVGFSSNLFIRNNPIIPLTTTSEIELLRLPTVVINDNKGVIKTTLEIHGITTKWHPDIGILEFSNNGKNYSLEIDPKTAIIYTPGRKTQGVTILVSDKKSPHWNNIFCDGDAVTLRLDGNKVVFADNSGFRYCGFKADQ